MRRGACGGLGRAVAVPVARAPMATPCGSIWAEAGGFASRSALRPGATLDRVRDLGSSGRDVNLSRRVNASALCPT